MNSQVEGSKSEAIKWKSPEVRGEKRGKKGVRTDIK